MKSPNIEQHFQSYPSFIYQPLTLCYHSLCLNCSFSSWSISQPQLGLSLAQLSSSLFVIIYALSGIVEVDVLIRLLASL